MIKSYITSEDKYVLENNNELIISIIFSEDKYYIEYKIDRSLTDDEMKQIAKDILSHYNLSYNDINDDSYDQLVFDVSKNIIKIPDLSSESKRLYNLLDLRCGISSVHIKKSF